MAEKKSALDWICLILVIVGGLNWGLIGAFSFDLVKAIFGGIPMLVTIIYDLVGLAALYMIYYLFRK